jgi:hypothetical protein
MMCDMMPLAMLRPIKSRADRRRAAWVERPARVYLAPDGCGANAGGGEMDPQFLDAAIGLIAAMGDKLGALRIPQALHHPQGQADGPGRRLFAALACHPNGWRSRIPAAPAPYALGLEQPSSRFGSSSSSRNTLRCLGGSYV